MTGPRWEKARCPWNFFFLVGIRKMRVSAEERSEREGTKGKGDQISTAGQYLRQCHSTRRKFCTGFFELLKAIAV